MKKTLVIPVWNDERRLPALLKALTPILKKDPMEVLFVDSASRDGSAALLREFAAKQKTARILREEKPGYANAFNLGLSEAKGELLLFLDGESIPDAAWVAEMTEALATHDLVVGQTESLLEKRPDAYAKVMATLFKGRSARSASGEGFAFPWGPFCNFGARREWFKNVGPLSPAAGAAYDMDWCWRAVLAGAVIGHNAKAKVQRARPEGREAVLHHFDAYGQGEAWIHQTYAFLLGEDAHPDALLTANDAYLRLRRYSPAAKVKALAEPLEEVAVAFSGGIRVGYDRGAAPCGMKRAAPKKAIGWETGKKKELTIFVPGRGVTTLPAQPAQIFRAWRAGLERDALEALFRKVFKASTHEAQHELDEFLAALAPADGPTIWTKVD